MAKSATHHSLSTIKRSQGQTATARIAYICRSEVFDERTSVRYRYSDKDGHLGAIQVVGYDGTPDAFANRLETAEKRKDAQVGRSTILALPNELDETSSAQVVLAFQNLLLERYGCASVSALHHEPGNNHAHIVEDSRDSQGHKLTMLSNKRTSAVEVEFRRESWAHLVNAELERSLPSHRECVDHRSLSRRVADGDEYAIGRTPMPHLGPARHATLRAKAKGRPIPGWALWQLDAARSLIGAVQELRIANFALRRLRMVQDAAQKAQRPLRQRKTPSLQR